ncbi:MAG: 5,10-methylenetetrahydrofolate reductase [Syntrophaceae bacterium CG2_30_49_12]|nr:MAG: 5,10-methylenetetrahydrofolate reductase [Syntrophaceae bacterium CG2_30_49_12]PIP06727.1 MAG: 5,10-methylenetetrahydrofolate reductase [Syntrophobacterales bacterium CG23_combo_of_CG06-09_8_20_14_all_48_27]PJA50665.1 MAG: 5,10-methylenetetrahydrofolate reductase [Syntrophobacterales bacterium CG_4_9_14_3_um_filter_49_8]PJC76993.1 MAG: 5,10-methylenetetrahydrofolate reductase [Syntrophobacterales bacterium CG_4_8_14_3_um_filter_49_14]
MTISFKETLASGKFIVTSEVGPPKGTNLEKMIHHIALLKESVAAINLTDHQSSIMRYPSLGAALLVKEQGGEPILQMTCRDRNRLALQADLLFAYSRGIKNVLCLTGDSLVVGDHKEARGVFDLDSSQLLAAIRTLEKGKDMGGNDLDGTVSFCAGAIVTPEANPLEPQLIKFEKKIEAGAEFIQTQAVYDLDKFRDFMSYARQFPVKILAGIILLTSAPMARYMNKNVPGVRVPQELIDEMAAAPKGSTLSKGIEIAGRMIREIKDDRICDGVHVMAIGKEEVVPEILKEAGL